MNRATSAINAATCIGISRRATNSEIHFSSARGAMIASIRGRHPNVITCVVSFRGVTPPTTVGASSARFQNGNGPSHLRCVLEIVDESEAAYGAFVANSQARVFVCLVAEEKAQGIAGTIGQIDVSANRHRSDALMTRDFASKICP
jgi:hypothetical protein